MKRKETQLGKLNQIVAVEKGVKGRAEKALTEAHHGLKKMELLSGISRVYKPSAEDGEQLPPEHKKVQLLAEDVIATATQTLVELFDVTATKDFANCAARADVEVDGKILVNDAPVTYLLWLEKRLTLLHVFVKELPRLNDAETWKNDPQTGLWTTDEEVTHRTKKVPMSFIKAPATDKHPAQAEVVHEDKIVGYWHTVKRSGAVPASRVRQLLDRVEKVQRAVKVAREAANMADAPKVEVGKKIFDYLFAA
jgi:hypothetical protein